jgi:hypothetical protein
MKAKSVAKDFPVVCVGGSAGGLDAYTRLLRHLPADMGVAIVIVNHLRTVATSGTDLTFDSGRSMYREWYVAASNGGKCQTRSTSFEDIFLPCASYSGPHLGI